MLILLAISSLAVSDWDTLRLNYGNPVGRIVWPYIKCVTDRDNNLPPRSIRRAMSNCRPAKLKAIKDARAGNERQRVASALRDFEARYMRFKLRSSHVRDD